MKKSMLKTILSFPASLYILLFFLFGLVHSMQAQITVGKNVQISAAHSKNTHAELLINIDPNDASQMVACSYIFRPGQSKYWGIGTIVYSSSDGGKTWAPTLGPEGLNESADPVCIFGNDGEAYFSVLNANGVSGTYLYRSDDGGRTWGEPLSLNFIDRQSLLVDNSQSKYRGSVYINGTGWVGGMEHDSRSALVVYYSRDGEHFNTSKRVELNSDKQIGGMGNGAVLSDGTVIFIFGSLLRDAVLSLSRMKPPRLGHPDGKLYTVTSADGGATLNTPVKVSDWYFEKSIRTGTIPYITADNSGGQFNDRIYANWVDRRSGRGEIYISFSDDKGKKWSTPIVVNDDYFPWREQNGPDHLNPIIRVNKDGVVAVMWQDRRDNPDNLGYWMRFSASLDGGETWLPSVRISEKPQVIAQDETWPLMNGDTGNSTDGMLKSNVRSNLFYFSGGDYMGMGVSATGAFQPAWIDNRTGVMQIWTAPVKVSGTVVKNGSAELASMENVSDKVTLELTYPTYDPKSSKLRVTAVLKNTSKDTLKGPIKIRAISIKSELGKVKIVDTDNELLGPGTTWDWSSLVKDGILPPEGKSAARQLTFSVTDILPFRLPDDGNFPLSLIKLDTRVFAKGVKKGDN